MARYPWPTSSPERNRANPIADLCVGATRTLPRKKVGQRNLAIRPFPFQVVEEPRLIMALCTGHVPVAGGLPRFDVDIHLVAEAAESRCVRESEEPGDKNEKENDSADQHDLDASYMGLGPLSGHPQELCPQRLNQLPKLTKYLHP